MSRCWSAASVVPQRQNSNTPLAHYPVSPQAVSPRPVASTAGRAPGSRASQLIRSIRWGVHSRCAALYLRHFPRSRPHVLPQRAGLTRCRTNLEATVLRRPPSVDHRFDLDKLALKSEPPRGLLAAVPTNRFCVLSVHCSLFTVHCSLSTFLLRLQASPSPPRDTPVSRCEYMRCRYPR